MSDALPLDAQTIATVKGTIPLLVETGPKFTDHFYKRMFSTHPELKDIFNMSNQRTGAQQQALFNAIALYATNIENPTAILPAVEKIAQKHASFQVTPDQYDIVGANILASLDELFSPGEEVLQAWAKAYKLLASIFVTRESQIYDESATKDGGWKGTRKFRIAEKIPQGNLITSFEFEPVDGKPVAAYKPGQYVGIWLRPAEFTNQEIRQYSLTRSSNGKSYRIAVKREPRGVVSQWLHGKAQVGDVVDLVVPVGDFFMDVGSDVPVTLISAGVGQTPLLAMLDTLSQERHSGEVNWFHAARDGDAHAFREEVERLGSQLPHFKRVLWYSSPTPDDRANSRFDIESHMSLSKCAKFSTASGGQYYICGPVKFMQAVASELLELGVQPEAIHYEVFGPDKVL